MEPAPGPVAPGEELEEQPLSRQVFIVQELEIRDRLASSRINKFLYLHTSERMPRRAHSNMVLGRCRRPPGQGAGSHPTHALSHTHAPLGCWRAWGLAPRGREERRDLARGWEWEAGAGTQGPKPSGTQSLPSAFSLPSKLCTWPPRPI